MKFGVFEDSPLAVRLCIFLKIRIILVKMVLSIVFVFLSAEDFPIFKNFLFSKINRSLSNIFKSMNRLLSLPTKIQIKYKNKKKSFKRCRIFGQKCSFFQSKMVFSGQKMIFFGQKFALFINQTPFHSKMSNFWSKMFIFSVENGLFGSKNDLF